MLRSIAVVGASLAGFRAAEALRAEGFDGTLTIVGAEEHPPYDRPPLSKQILAGDWEPDRLPLTGVDDDLTMDWRLGVAATALDLGDRRVELADGSQVSFDGLVIATGAAPRTLASGPMAGVHVLRTLDDALALRAELEARPARVVVVGAGFIGAEVAATCRGRGLAVTMIEPLPVPLGRVLGEEVGAALAALHSDEGVDVRLGVGVEAFDGSDRVERVRLSDGSSMEADVVVVGIGVVPSVGWLEGSGLKLDDGVVCDAACVAAPGVVAAGDVARWAHPGHPAPMRVEHWDHAISQGTHAAIQLLAGESTEPYAPVPWFWSDQFDRKIQLAGRTDGFDEVRVIDGSLDERRFVALYRRGDRVIAALGVNRPGPLARWRGRLAADVGWDDALAESSA